MKKIISLLPISFLAGCSSLTGFGGDVVSKTIDSVASGYAIVRATNAAVDLQTKATPTTGLAFSLIVVYAVIAASVVLGAWAIWLYFKNKRIK